MAIKNAVGNHRIRLMLELIVSGVLFSTLLMIFLTACRQNQGIELERIDEANKLTIYTSHKEEVYGPIIREFEERTGIWVEVKTGGTNELLETIAKEQGRSEADLMFGGGVDSLEAYGDYFQSYVSKQQEALESTYASPDHKYVVFSKIPMVMIYNRKLVDPSESPMSWKALLSEAWQGEIAFANPERSGSAYTALVTLIQVMARDMPMEEVICRFTDNLDGQQCDSSGSVIQEVQNGNKCMGVVLEETIKKQLKNCPDIEMVYPEEGMSMLPDGCAILKHAPHPKNAACFMEFVIGEEVQRLLGDQLCRRSVRKDLAGAGATYELIYDMAYAQKNRTQILKKWREHMQE